MRALSFSTLALKVSARSAVAAAASTATAWSLSCGATGDRHSMRADENPLASTR